MKSLNIEECVLVSAGCGDNSCQMATLDFLEVCSMEQMFEINKIFKQILLSDAMKDADSDTKKAALIAAIENITL